VFRFVFIEEVIADPMGEKEERGRKGDRKTGRAACLSGGVEKGRGGSTSRRRRRRRRRRREREREREVY